MSDLAVFLAARLDDDEAAAGRAAERAGPGWQNYDEDGEADPNGINAGFVLSSSSGDVIVYDEGCPTVAEAAHIARHDPGRVLRDVEARRKILAEHPIRLVINGTCAACSDKRGISWRSIEAGGGSDLRAEFVDWPCPTLRALAAVYSDHPDYDQEWA